MYLRLCSIIVISTFGSGRDEVKERMWEEIRPGHSLNLPSRYYPE